MMQAQLYLFLQKSPDSMWWKPAPLNPDTNNVIVMVKSTDPPGLGNYVRYYNKEKQWYVFCRVKIQFLTTSLLMAPLMKYQLSRELIEITK